MELGGWLRSLDLEQYEAAFRENAIDEKVLPHLTDQDLEKLGVLLGHRRRLLRAIANFESTTKDDSAMSSRAAPLVRFGQDTAERRQLTVLFSDLVGSTALSTCMDPEDLREVIATYHNCVAEIVRRFDGYVAQYLGDGVLVYFGYPQAHEDDAERAVRTGLELPPAICGLKARVSLQTRVGIATGTVVVGDLMRSGNLQECGIVGETPNLAARLQTIAEPNTTVIAEGTRRLLGNLFELQDLGFRELKGIAGPVRAWRALRTTSVASRFEALHASGLTTLVGRQEESEFVSRCWSKAEIGEGQVVLLSGEAGIGKSRLAAALQERLANDPHVRLRYFCSSQHTDSALYPIIGQMERAAGLSPDDTPQAKLDKLHGVLARTSTSIEDAALFAEMLSLANDGRYPALKLTAERRRQRTLDALTGQVLALTRSSPVLMIFEDAHWSDPTSLEALGRIVDRIATLRMLLIVTFRPEFDAPWLGRPHVTFLTINRLAQREVEVMIDRVIGNKVLPTSIRQDIVERTDGIPLFVEEMTKALLEVGSASAPEDRAAAVPFATLSLPATLNALLMARLDRLGAAKEVAQVAAAIGRRFSHALLAAVVRQPEAELEMAIGRLVAAGLLFRQGVPPHANYLFKHALVQDAAYSTLLRERRRALHARIVETLEDQFGDVAEREPELLARHCAEAALADRAAKYWVLAAQRALARSANLEVVGHISRGLDLLLTLPDTTEKISHELNLKLALGAAYWAIRGFASSDVEQTFTRARNLATEIGDVGRLVVALRGLYGCYYARGDLTKARNQADYIVALADQNDNYADLCVGRLLRGQILFWQGGFIQARRELEGALSLYSPETQRAKLLSSQIDPAINARIHLGWTLWMLGYPDTALRATEEAVDAARHLEQPFGLAMALFWNAVVKLYRGERAAADETCVELRTVTTEYHLSYLGACATVLEGEALIARGQVRLGIAKIREALVDFRCQQAGLGWPWAISLTVVGCLRASMPNEGLKSIDEAFASMEKNGERAFEAELHRLKGELLCSGPDPHINEAHACFAQAVSIATSQGAKSLMLRAAISLARLRPASGPYVSGHRLLQDVYSQFTEGFETADLREARRLDNQLQTSARAAH